jgi:hypothetical protein
MRHLYGIVLGILMAAALFLGGGWGFYRLSTLMADTSPHMTGVRAVTSLGALLAIGLVLGVLMAVPQVSPLATALPALAALGWTALYVVSTSRAVDLIPMKSSNFGHGAHTLLATGLFALVGAVMLVPLFVPSRWRRPENEEGDDSIGVAAASSYLS